MHQEQNKHKTVIAIVGIVVLELYALSQGINGVLLSTAVATIAGLGTFFVGKKV